VFTAAWGLLEYLAFKLDLSFPYQLFNNNPTENPEQRGRVLYLGIQPITRITSVAVEPSMFAQSMLPILPIVAFAFWSGRPLLSAFMDRIALTLMLIALLLSTSTSAYAGLLLLVTATLGGLALLGRLTLRPVVSIGMVIATLVVVYATSPAVRDFVFQFIISKPGSDSGLERLATTLNAWGYFRQYPVLGLGWGSVPSGDLVVYLLANAGVIGLASFVLFAGALLQRLGAALRAARGRQGTAPLAYRVAGVGVGLVTLLGVGATARFTWEYGHVWVVLGLSLGAVGAGFSASRTADA
jgi:hypothetical protein